MHKDRAVGYWLLAGVFMVIIQVLLGGVTRLTGSGLSITEWKPIMGALPPMSEEAWQSAFGKYQQIAQYKELNSHFTLADFKSIFFWEWFHRLWARMLGIVFLIGFVFFLIKGYFRKDMIIPLIILFLLGGLVAMVGWIMVMSGLNDTSLYVSHIKLSIHFITAMACACYTLWFALKMLVPQERRIFDPGLYRFTFIVLIVLVLQLIYGAWMAGLKAAPVAPTWPDMNGVWVPHSFPGESWINSSFNVQFIHRQLAYLLGTLVIFWFGAAGRKTGNHPRSLIRQAKWWPLILVLLQVCLGIFTVLHAPGMGSGKFGSFELLAEAHQLVAMFLLCSLMVNLYLVKRTSAAGGQS
jgi:cytochrome c oxidase assembly protein subunit 15